MSDPASSKESVLIFRVSEDRIPQVLKALEGVDLGVRDDVGAFLMGSRISGSARQTRPTGMIAKSPHDGVSTDTCVGDIA